MLPLSSRRSSTLAMSKRSYFASRTPRATFSKSQKTAMLIVASGSAMAGRSIALGFGGWGGSGGGLGRIGRGLLGGALAQLRFLLLLLGHLALAFLECVVRFGHSTSPQSKKARSPGPSIRKKG